METEQVNGAYGPSPTLSRKAAVIEAFADVQRLLTASRGLDGVWTGEV
jgi:hypothetical protein